VCGQGRREAGPAIYPKETFTAGHDLLDSFIVIFQAHYVILAEIVAKLNFDDCQFDVAAVSQAMISFRWDVDVLTLLQSQLAVATDNVGDAFDYDPMLASSRVSLKTESRAGFYFQHFNFEAGSFFQDFVAAPWSLVKLSHSAFLPSPTAFAQLICKRE
jgi:hypothetical protein